MLLPEGAPLPSEETRSRFPQGFDFQVRGFRVAGSPIGTDDFVREFAEQKLAEAVAKLQAIKSLGCKSARATHRLLVTCGTKLFSFLASTVPPSLLAPIVDKFDQHLLSVFFNTLAPEGVTCSRQRKKRAKLRASLPAPFGCSLFRAADQCKAAWLSSLAACLSDPLLFRLRFGLQRFVDPAWKNLTDALGGVNSKHWSLVSQLLPTTAAGFLDGSMFCPQSEGKVKFSKVILKLLSRLRVEKFFALTSVENLSLTLTEADILRAQAPTLAGRIFTTSLKFDSPFFHK
jgi:hypothetical protein